MASTPGREALFVAVDELRWGRVGAEVPVREEVVLHDEPEVGDQDLLDRAAIRRRAPIPAAARGEMRTRW